MPEGDTVWRTARRLHEALANEVILSADLRWPGLSTADLRGMRTLEVVSQGKNLIHRLDLGLTLYSHLRMEGRWQVEATGQLSGRAMANPQLRAVIATEQWSALGLRLGRLKLVATRDEPSLVGHLGPDLLGPTWDADEAARRLAASQGNIGMALLDQSNLAGLGTLYASEALFMARINPWRPASGLNVTQIDALVDLAYRLLNINRREAIQSTTGVRRHGQTTYVHGRSGRPCRRCSETIRVSAIGDPPLDRTFFYCPVCQGGLAPGDDGRPQVPLGSSARSPGRRRLS